MSFTCGTHGWRHQLNPCPNCENLQNPRASSLVPFKLKLRCSNLCKCCGNLAQVKEALEAMVAHSYSWVMVQETAHIMKPIHDRYRMIAKDALGKL